MAVLGASVVTTPLAVAGAFAAMAVLSIVAGADQDRVMRLMSALPEVGLSLSAGLCTATAVLADPGVELQVSLPARFTRTIARRIAIVLGIHGGLAALVTLVLQAAGWWTPPLGVAAAQLAWLAPTLWLAGMGAVIGLLTGARSAVAGVLGTWWLAQNLFVWVFLPHGWSRHLLLFVTAHLPGVEFWLANRVWLLAQAAGLLIATFVFLRRPEALLTRDD
jgi:hypothetical protein